MRHRTLSETVPHTPGPGNRRPAVLPGHARVFRLSLEELPSDADGIAVPSSLERAVPSRQLQFRAGRYCAMKAMDALSGARAAWQVGRSDADAPLWPAGVVGSITHTNDFASAAVAWASDAAGIGIDSERIMSESQVRQVSRMIAWPVEIAHARTAGLGRLEAFTLVFSAKESIFKCLHPMLRRYFDFHDVRIVGVDGRDHTFTARIVRTLSDRFRAQAILEGRFDVEAPWVHTGIALAA